MKCRPLAADVIVHNGRGYEQERVASCKNVRQDNFADVRAGWFCT